MDQWVREVMHLMDTCEFLCGSLSDPIVLHDDLLGAIDLCVKIKLSLKVKRISVSSISFGKWVILVF